MYDRKKKCIAATRKLNKQDLYLLCYDPYLHTYFNKDKYYSPIGVLNYIKPYPSLGIEMYNSALLNLAKLANDNTAKIEIEDEREWL